MRMAKDDRVDTRHLGQAGDGVFGEEDGGAKLKTRVGHHHHHVGAFSAHARHQSPCGFRDVACGHLAQQMQAVPLHDLRRHEADHADFEGMHLTGFVGEAAVQQHIGRKGGLALVRAAVFNHVGADVGKGRAGQRLAQKGQAVVELVVAHVGGVIAQRVHHFESRMNLAFLQGLDAGDVVAQGVALQQVAGVEEQVVGYLRAGGLDQGRGARQPVLGHRLVLVVVIGHQVHVHVGGAQNTQLELLRLGPAWAEKQREERRGAGQQVSEAMEQWCHVGRQGVAGAQCWGVKPTKVA